MEIKIPDKNRLKRAFALFISIYMIISFALLLWSTGGNILRAFRGVDYLYLLGAFFLSITFLLLDAFRLHLLSIGFGKPLSILYSAEIILSGFILAITTPFGSGGLPYQLWLLSRRGYALGEGFLLIIFRGFVLFVPYILLLPMAYNAIDSQILRYLFFYAVGVALAVLLGILIRGDFRRRLLSINLRYLLYAVFVSIPAQLIYLSILYFVMHSKGIEAGYMETLSTQLLLQLTTYFSPSPGGLGIAEVISSFVLSSNMEKDYVGMVVLLWRFFTSYVFAIVGFFVIIRRLSLSDADG